MPPFSTDDYYKLLQKIAVLETKILRLEVNMEVNGQYGNETTLPMTQISGKEQANRQMLCAKPKHNSWKDKSPPSDMGRRLTGRTQHLETRDDTEWPALPSHCRSTPVPRRKQPWNVAKTKSKSKPTKDTGILLENRFAPLLQDPDSPKETSSSSTGKRYEAKSYTKRLQKEQKPTVPKRLIQTLIVGDYTLKNVRSSTNTKVLIYPNDTVSDLTRRIGNIVEEHPNVQNIVLHIGTNDVVKRESEVLKKDFIDLLNTVSYLKAEVTISGPLPPIGRGDEKFSRLMNLNTFLYSTCSARSVCFIDNFNFFWDRRHFFTRNGVLLNRSGVQLFLSNLFYFLRHPSVPSVKANGQQESERADNSEQRRQDPPPPQLQEDLQPERRHHSEEKSPDPPSPSNQPSPAPQTPSNSISSLDPLSPSNQPSPAPQTPSSLISSPASPPFYRLELTPLPTSISRSSPLLTPLPTSISRSSPLPPLPPTQSRAPPPASPPPPPRPQRPSPRPRKGTVTSVTHLQNTPSFV